MEGSPKLENVWKDVALVSNSDVTLGKRFGKQIDSHESIWRFNRFFEQLDEATGLNRHAQVMLILHIFSYNYGPHGCSTLCL